MQDINKVIDETSFLTDVEVLIIFGKITQQTDLKLTDKGWKKISDISDAALSNADFDRINELMKDLIDFSDDNIALICIDVGLKRDLPYPKIVDEPPPIIDPVYVISKGKCFHAIGCEALDTPGMKGMVKVPIERADVEDNYYPCPICVRRGVLKP